MNQGLRQNGIASLTPGPSPRGEKGEADPLELIAAGRHSVEAVCRESGMSILELAEHVCTAENIAALGRVAQLHVIEREMLLGRLKRDALMRLRELTDEVPAASADEVRAAEVMRKACADLLRNWESGSRTRSNPSEPGGAWHPGGGGPRSRGYHPDSITPAFEAEVLEALERLGEESLVPWSKAKPQATRKKVSGVEITHEVQVGMAFGKTSDHGTEPNRTDSAVPMESGLRCQWHPPQEIITIRTNEIPMPMEICNGTEASKPNGEDGSRFEDGHPP